VYPDHLRVTEGAAPDVKHKNHTITADVMIPKEGAEGVLMTHGGRFGGYGLFVKDGQLTYHHNLVGVNRYEVTSDTPLPTGKVELKAVYKTDKDAPFSGATVTLYANNKKVGKGRVEKSLPTFISQDETFDVGFDTGTPVTEAYETPFDFSGVLDKVTIDLN
jgi:arylsulfatase